MLAFLSYRLDILLQRQNVTQHLLHSEIIDSAQMSRVRDEEALHKVAETVKDKADIACEHIIGPMSVLRDLPTLFHREGGRREVVTLRELSVEVDNVRVWL